MDYTSRISENEYQIRDVTWLPALDQFSGNRHLPLEFDIVRWKHHEPQTLFDLKAGKTVTATEHCYSIGFLVWDPHEPQFQLKSVGIRWLEEGEIPKEFIQKVCEFCDVMTRLLLEHDMEGATIADLPMVHDLWKEWEETLHDLLSRV